MKCEWCGAEVTAKTKAVIKGLEAAVCKGGDCLKEFLNSRGLGGLVALEEEIEKDIKGEE